MNISNKSLQVAVDSLTEEIKQAKDAANSVQDPLCKKALTLLACHCEQAKSEICQYLQTQSQLESSLQLLSQRNC